MNKFQYKYYLLALLTIVAAFSYLDRGILGLAMESIKLEFKLSDSQLGFMSGFAFALFYAVAGIPIARWADRGNRNQVIALTTGLWSVMVVISGFVGNFTQLLLVRVGVAVGESGCVPPAQSLLTDYFNRAELPRAMAIYWMSVPLSTILAYLGGGWLIEQYGWRITFIAIGLPGLLLAVLVKMTLREPRLERKASSTEIINRETDNVQTLHTSQISLKQVLKTLWKKLAFRHVVIAFCITTFFGAGIGVWIPAFFMRSHGMAAGELGTWLAFTWGFGGLVFTFLGGVLATRYAPRQENLQMKWISFILVLATVFHILCYLSTNQYMALLFVSIVAGVLLPMINAAVYSAIQNLVEERSRAVALAFIFMLSSLVGLGLGPLAVGVISDALPSNLGPESLRYALLLFSPGYAWGAFHCWKAASTIEEEIRAVELKADLKETKEVTKVAEAGLEPPNSFSTVS